MDAVGAAVRHRALCGWPLHTVGVPLAGRTGGLRFCGATHRCCREGLRPHNEYALHAP